MLIGEFELKLFILLRLRETDTLFLESVVGLEGNEPLVLLAW